MNARSYCSDLTRLSGEPIGGTAPFADQFIFISWPKKLWNHDALESRGGFPVGLKSWSKSNSQTGRKITIRLLSNPDIETNQVHLFFYPQAKKISGIEPDQIPETLECWLESPVNPNLEWEPVIKEQFFVCTHGRHDLCCAKYGQIVYQKFRDEILQRELSLDVWEASHLGGHRFAANVMHFPGGHSHGHLTEDMVPAFLDAWETGTIYAPTYRGCSYLEGKEQIASAQLIQYCADLGWNAELNLNEIGEGTETEFHYEASLHPRNSKKSGDTEKSMPNKIKAWFRTKEFQNPGACDALDEIKTRKSWFIQQVQILE